MPKSVEKQCVIHIRPLTETEHKRIVLAAAIAGLTQKEFILLACETEIKARNLKQIIDTACSYGGAIEEPSEAGEADEEEETEND